MFTHLEIASNSPHLRLSQLRPRSNVDLFIYLWRCCNDDFQGENVAQKIDTVKGTNARTMLCTTFEVGLYIRLSKPNGSFGVFLQPGMFYLVLFMKQISLLLLVCFMF